MKSTLLSLIVVLLGVALGVGVATLRLGDVSAVEQSAQDSKGLTSVPNQPGKKPTPILVVEQKKYDFGTLDIAAKGAHDFIFRNVGSAPLKLSSGGTSCHCTVSKLGDSEVPPGCSTKVAVSWKPIDDVGPFEQTATILTNDPDQPRVTLTISGRVTALLRFLPPELTLSEIASGEPSTADVRLVCYLKEPLKILGHDWVNAATARYFNVAFKPLSGDELKRLPTARNGFLVTVTVMPGLPQGAFRQKLRLKTNLAAMPTITLPIQGTVGKPITIVGPDWDSDAGVLALGMIKSETGATRRLTLVVRGPGREQVAFKAVRVSAGLRVSFGEKHAVNDGAIVTIPLVIEVPPGSHSRGLEGGKLDEIVLETTNPQAAELRILVRYAVMN